MVDTSGGWGSQATDPRLAKRQRIDVSSAYGVSGNGDITSQIANALKQSISRLQQPAPVAEMPADDLAARLRQTLGGMMPSEVMQNSEIGQQLFQTVQQQNVAPMAAPFSSPFALTDYGQYAPPPAEYAPPLHYGTVAPPKRELREEDQDSDDGAPHRLPPGFGAIPEDIVEERARLKEEQRMLAIKATQPCRFGTRCKRRDCPNMHPEGRDIDTTLNPCAFGRRCKRKGCFYDHSEGRDIDDNPTIGQCKWGQRCSRPDCLYDHPEGRQALVGAEARICFFCHDPGHLAGDCHLNPESWKFRDGPAGPPPKALSLTNGTA